MKFSKEKIEQIKSEVRSYLARNPKASCRTIAQALGYDFKFINWLKNEVHKELANSILHENLQEEIGKFELLIEETGEHLWEIITDTTAEKKEKVNAIKTLIGNYSLLLEKKIASGFFSQKPKEEKKRYTPEELKDRLQQIIFITKYLENLEKEERETEKNKNLVTKNLNNVDHTEGTDSMKLEN